MKALLGITSLFMAVVTALTVSLCVSFENNKDFKNDVTHKLESSAITKNIEDLEQELLTAESDIRNIENEILETESKISYFENELNELKTNQDPNSSDINSLETEINSLKTSLNGLRNSYDAHYANYNTLYNNFNSLKTSFNNYKPSSSVSRIIEPSNDINISYMINQTTDKIYKVKMVFNAEYTVTSKNYTLKQDGTFEVTEGSSTFDSGSTYYLYYDSCVFKKLSLADNSYNYYFVSDDFELQLVKKTNTVTGVKYNAYLRVNRSSNSSIDYTLQYGSFDSFSVSLTYYYLKG